MRVTAWQWRTPSWWREKAALSRSRISSGSRRSSRAPSRRSPFSNTESSFGFDKLRSAKPYRSPVGFVFLCEPCRVWKLDSFDEERPNSHKEEDTHIIYGNRCSGINWPCPGRLCYESPLPRSSHVAARPAVHGDCDLGHRQGAGRVFAGRAVWHHAWDLHKTRP